MIYSLTGTLEALAPADAHFVAVLNVGGVGFELRVSQNTAARLGALGSALTLRTYLHVREDALELAGFFDEEELLCYRSLLSVSGVGQKAALAILSVLSPSRLSLAVAAGDSAAIAAAKGVGKKTAEVIVAKLKGRISASGEDYSSVSAAAGSATSSAAGEAIAALAALGYSQSQAAAAVTAAGSGSVEELIKAALKNM